MNFILEWTRCHTFYTQYLYHRLVRNVDKKIDVIDVKRACAEILQEGAPGFIERRNLLTDKQWKFLKAVAKEGSVKQPTAGGFIGTAAAVKCVLEALVKKELLLETLSLEGKSYSVYNVFFCCWLESI